MRYQEGLEKNVNPSCRDTHPPEMIFNMIQNLQKNRSLSFGIRDQRIDDVKMRQSNLRND